MVSFGQPKFRGKQILDALLHGARSVDELRLVSLPISGLPRADSRCSPDGWLAGCATPGVARCCALDDELCWACASSACRSTGGGPRGSCLKPLFWTMQRTKIARLCTCALLRLRSIVEHSAIVVWTNGRGSPHTHTLSTARGHAVNKHALLMCGVSSVRCSYRRVCVQRCRGWACAAGGRSCTRSSRRRTGRANFCCSSATAVWCARMRTPQ